MRRKGKKRGKHIVFLDQEQSRERTCEHKFYDFSQSFVYYLLDFW